METVPVTDFIPTLRKMVNVPLPFMLTDALVKASQEFCRKSQEVVYTRKFDSVPAYSDVTLISDSDLNAESRQFKSSVVLSITAFDVGTGSRRPLSKIDDYTVHSRDVINFNNSFTDVQVLCAIEPTNTATVLPVSLYEDYLSGVCSGAASLLLTQPDSDWFDASLANHHQELFIAEVVTAKRFRLEANPESKEERRSIKRTFY